MYHANPARIVILKFRAKQASSFLAILIFLLFCYCKTTCFHFILELNWSFVVNFFPFIFC